MTLDIQALTIVHMSLAGCYLGVAIDTYMRVWPIRSWMARIVTDVLFWVVQAVLIFVWLQAVNNGQMRIYVFVSLLLGYVTYRAIFQPYYRHALESVIGIVRSVLQGIWRVIRALIISPLVMVWRLLVSLFALLGAGLLYVGVGCWRLLRGLGMITAVPLVRILVRYTFGRWYHRNEDEADEHESNNENDVDERNDDNPNDEPEHSDVTDEKYSQKENKKKEQKKRGFFAFIANWFGKKRE